VAIAPHWTWPGREGQPIKVFVTCNAETVALMLNGRDLGVQRVDRIMGNEWTIPYAPGRIEARAMRGGKVVATAVHETAGAPVALRLTPARLVMAGDDEDAQPITIDAIDARGRHVPISNLATRFTVEGATLLGVGNGDPNSHEPEQFAGPAGERSLFNGLAQVIVRADAGRGRISVRATASGLKPALLELDRADIAPRSQVAVVQAALKIRDWRRSSAFTLRPDPGLAPADGDNNSWDFIHSGDPTPGEAQPGWRLYRARITPWKRIAAEGGVIAFDAVGGRAELWIDGSRIAVKEGTDTAPLRAPIAPGAGPRIVALLVYAPAGQPSGILGPVAVTAR
jgi:beta-galactosidase